MLETFKNKWYFQGEVKMYAFSPLLGFSGELYHDRHRYVTLLLVCAECQPASHPFLGEIVERFELVTLH